MKKFRSRKIPNGRANAVWASQIPMKLFVSAERLHQLEDRDERDLGRDHHQGDDEQEERVAERGS